MERFKQFVIIASLTFMLACSASAGDISGGKSGDISGGKASSAYSNSADDMSVNSFDPVAATLLSILQNMFSWI